jgi:signal peptidase I
MTRPGPPPPRGRHAAPDGDARPDEGVPAGRHAAADEPPRRRHAAPDRAGYPDPPPARRHAAPDEPADGVAYHRPTLGNTIRYPPPDPSPNGHGATYGPNGNGVTYGPEPSANGHRGTYRPDPAADGYGAQPGANGHGGYTAPGHGQHRADPSRYGPDDRPEPPPTGNGYRPESGPTGNGYQPEPRPTGSEYRPESGPTGHGYQPEPGPNGNGYRPAPNRHGYQTEQEPTGSDYRSEPGSNGNGYLPGSGPAGHGYQAESGPSENGHRSERSWTGYPGQDGTGPGGYPAPGTNLGRHRSEPGPNGDGSRQRRQDAYWAPGSGGVGTPGGNGAEADRDAYQAPGPVGYHLPGSSGTERRRAGDPSTNGVAYHRPEPGAHRYSGPDLAPHPWPETNGYHLTGPAPPTVNGYRLDEPVAPVTGFPYSAPPPTPVAYPVNGHGVDAAERDAASWPVSRVQPIERDRPADPQIAVVPLTDEPTEVLDRPTPKPDPKPAAGKSTTKPPHPPRAVVRRRAARRKALEWPFLIVFAVVSAFLIRQYVVQTFYIPSASMHETLIEGDRVLVNKVGYHLHDIHRGDVVVFAKPPNLDVSEDDLIKRVVALPGETVEGRGGKVYVNGAALNEPYVEPLCHGTAEFAKVSVPAGKLWVMGDNRCNSSDSRVFGPIDEHLVVGRAFVIAWPFDRLSWL